MTASVAIGSDVWIGDGVTILSGVSVGDGACIAAGAVVTENVALYEVVGGIPAKRIRYRFGEDVREFLLEIEWWNWSDSRIRRNREFFMADLSEIRNVQTVRDLIRDRSRVNYLRSTDYGRGQPIP